MHKYLHFSPPVGLLLQININKPVCLLLILMKTEGRTGLNATGLFTELNCFEQFFCLFCFVLCVLHHTPAGVWHCRVTKHGLLKFCFKETAAVRLFVKRLTRPSARRVLNVTTIVST